MDDLQFRRLLEYLGFSWDGFRKVRKGVKKRISRHLQMLGCRNMHEYLAALDRSDEIMQECRRLMTVSISRFFRDPPLWECLENEILPALVRENKRKIRVWSAGCASGEEVYSFRIRWDRLEKHFGMLSELELTGTDMNPVYLSRSRAGVYSPGSLREVPDDIRTEYFEVRAKGKSYAVKSEVKKDIAWKQHHLLYDEPIGSGFDIIFLRNNILTYYGESLKTIAFRKVTDCLIPSGFLIIGSHEKLPFGMDDLIRFASCAYIFRKK